MIEGSLINDFLDVSHLSKGVYFIQFSSSENETSLLKFVKD